MNKTFKFVSLVACSLLLSQSALAVVVGDPYKAPIVMRMDGKASLSADTLKGKVTVINFWATWCEACKVELKEMEQVFAPLFPNRKFQFAMVSLDKEPKAAKNWVMTHLNAAKKMQQYLYSDPEFAAAGALEVDAFPMTLIVGPDLKVVYVQRGFVEGSGATQTLKKRAQALLK